MYKKGDVILIKQEVYGIRDGNKRVLFKPFWFKPIKGIVIGYSFIHTGTLKKSKGTISFNFDNYEPGFLTNITDCKVWLIEPIINTERYLKPIRALESDIELSSISKN